MQTFTTQQLYEESWRNLKRPKWYKFWGWTILIILILLAFGAWVDGNKNELAFKCRQIQQTFSPYKNISPANSETAELASECEKINIPIYEPKSTH